MISVLQNVQWTFFSIVHTETDFGRQSSVQIRKNAVNAGLCVTLVLSLSSDLSTATIEAVLKTLVSSGATAVVFAGEKDAALSLSSVALSYAGAGSLQWIFLDLFSDSLVNAAGANYLKGALTITPSVPTLTQFKNYWTSINVGSSTLTNAWFNEWFMTVNKCRFPNINYAPYNNYPTCSTSGWANNYVQSPYIISAIYSVYAYANALKRAQLDLCTGSGICPQLIAMTSETFFAKYISSTNITFGSQERLSDLSTNNRLTFTKDGFVLSTGFDIWNVNDLSGKLSFQKVNIYQMHFTNHLNLANSIK